MSDTRRTRLADFLGRLVSEKPLGVVGGVIVLLLIVVAVFADVLSPYPFVLLLLTIMSVVGQGLTQTIVVLGVAGGIPGSRIIRGAVIGIKEGAYFQAAEAIGSSKSRTLMRHVLPNTIPLMIIIFSINIGGVKISEASITVYSLNMLGDAVRDVLDPRLRGGVGRLDAAGAKSAKGA